MLPADANSSKKVEVTGIQYLRGIAAIAVVLDHSSGMGALTKYFGAPTFGGVLKYGDHGVDLFFVISGFIIAYVTLRRGTLEAELSFIEFCKRRAFRILPLMWLATGAYAALRALSDIPINWMDSIRAATLFPVGQVAPLNIWTLRHEMLFYLIFGLCWLASSRLRYGLFFWFIAPLFLLGTIPGSELIGFLLSPVNLEFGAGFCLGLIFLRTKISQPQLPGQFGILLLASISLVYVAFLYGQSLGTLQSTLIVTVFSTLLVALAAFTIPAKRNRIGVLLGEASYSIYLFHPHFISAMLRCLRFIWPGMPPHGAVTCAAILGIAGGIIVHLVVEKPLLRHRGWHRFRRQPDYVASTS